MPRKKLTAIAEAMALVLTLVGLIAFTHKTPDASPHSTALATSREAWSGAKRQESCA